MCAPSEQELQEACLKATLALGSKRFTEDEDWLHRALVVGDWKYRVVAAHIERKGIPLGMGRLQFPGSMFPVEAKPSPIHGVGLFVTEDVEPGSLLTLYPNDAIIGFYPGSANTYVIPGQGRTQSEVWEIHQAYGHVQGTHEGLRLQGIGYPELTDSPAYLGHLANDASGPRLSARRYEKLVYRRRNASIMGIHSPLHGCVVAVEAIPKGGEVLVVYGHEYWVEQNRNVGTERVASHFN